MALFGDSLVGCLQKSSFGQADVSSGDENDVIRQAEAQQAAGAVDLLRGADVLGRYGERAGGVVVAQDDGFAAQGVCPAEDHALVDGGGAETALAYPLAHQDFPGRGEVEDPELFVVQVAHFGFEGGEYVLRGADHGGFVRFPGGAAGDFETGSDLDGGGLADAFDRAQFAGAHGGNACEAARGVVQESGGDLMGGQAGGARADQDGEEFLVREAFRAAADEFFTGFHGVCGFWSKCTQIRARSARLRQAKSLLFPRGKIPLAL